MTSIQQSFLYKDFIGSIQGIVSGRQLTTAEESALAAVNNAAQGFKGLEKCCKENERRAVTFVTRRFFETGDHTLSGTHRFTGSLSATGSVDIAGYATETSLTTVSNNLTTLSNRVTGSLAQIDDARQQVDTITANGIPIPIGDVTTGDVKGLIEVPYNSFNYSLNLTGSTDMANGSFRRFTIINNGDTNLTPKYAVSYLLDSFSPTTMNVAFIGVPNDNKPNIQEVIITKFSNTVKVYSTVTYFDSTA